MSTKAHLRAQLEQARAYSEALLADFSTPDEWLHQVHPHANHALWFAGHMGLSDNFFISQIAPELRVNRPEFQAHFGTGSVPSSQLDDYPPIADVLEFMRDRRGVLLALLERLPEEDLSKPTSKSSAKFLPDVASVFQTAIWHEGLHSGQVSVTRRSLGRPCAANARDCAG